MFFSTSNAGGKAPAMATVHTELKDANDIAELSKCDIIIYLPGRRLHQGSLPQDPRCRLEWPLD